jgi:hypothetical protein
MQKWEYRYVSIEVHSKPTEELYGEHKVARHLDVEYVLNQLGGDGWMLVQFSLDSGIFVFKRPLA